MRKCQIAVLAGDGIGPEIIAAALPVLTKALAQAGREVEYQEALIGGAAIDAVGNPYPQQTDAMLKAADAVLLGAVGGHKWDDLPTESRPETGLLKMRASLNLYANLRPAIIYQPLRDASPLRADILGDSLDILLVRELTGGIYFGPRQERINAAGIVEAYDTEIYNEEEIRRIAQVAIKAAKNRSGKIISVDKANVLASSRLWRRIVTDEVAKAGGVSVEHIYVDNAAMQLVRDPHQFDVILTSNMFGDILSDLASMLTGSIGMLPSASLGEEGQPGVYEPIHGSAPDLAGKNMANPCATILSCSMLIRYSYGLEQAAKAIEQAVAKVLSQGYRTADIAAPGERAIGARQMAELILAEI